MKTHNGKILVVDDDIDLQDIIVGFFKPRGYEVVVYDDAEVAYKDLKSEKLSCDVILTDLVLPTISGIEFTKMVKELGIDVPIVVMTVNKKVEIAIEAIQSGAYDFVVKPLHFPQLLVSIERALYFMKIQRENSTLKTAVRLQSGADSIDGIIGKSPGIRTALDLAKRVSTSSSNVLITGESGSGKEVIAKAIHNLGNRKRMPFIAINCSAIPENLLESELFGHAKGSFTGAVDKKIGLFEEAEGGTLFLDEIGDLGLPLQSKLLRVLQERKIKRIGENQFRNIDIRIIAATHKDLRKAIKENLFREDLFFRLNVIPITVPPLRSRKEDIIPLAEFFLKKFAALEKSPVKVLSKKALESLLANPWRGNVRELENAIERAVVLCESNTIQTQHIELIENMDSDYEDKSSFDFKKMTASEIMSIDDLTKQYVQYVLKLNNGAKDKTAKDLKIDRKTLYRKLNEMNQSSHQSNQLPI